MSQSLSWERVDGLLLGVERPARYTGGELNAVVKPQPLRARIALCFPDLYEIAESFLGFKILYDIVNAREDLAAERVYAVAPDLEQRLRATATPLWSLESRRPLSAFDVAGFTLQYELSFPTILAMLELGGVSLRASARRVEEPYVIGGGAGAFHPEPLAPFFDAFVLGDGEHAVTEILDCVAACRDRGLDRAATLVELAKLEGVYVPSHFDVVYDGLRVRELRARPGAPLGAGVSRHGTPRVARRVLPDLDAAPYPVRQIQPNVQPVHDRMAIEVQRGCSQGCRFCQAGMIQRPTRQRRPESVIAIADAAMRESGLDTLGLLSLSAGDYGPLDRVLGELLERCEPRKVSLSLPSLRTETLTPSVAARVNEVSSMGFTLAPEAGSERLRRVINKTNDEADLLAAVRAAVSAGARTVKLYFMLGLPTETDDDLDAIVELATRARAAGRTIRRDAQVAVSVSTFVPKPHTPFQWERQITADETRAKQRRLREQLRARRITLRYHDAGQSFIEGVLARGDRRLAPALEAAMRAGCRLDGWSEHFDLERWQAALAAELAPFGLSAGDYLQERDESALLAWDHLDAGLLKKFLRKERRRAETEATLVDCALGDQCHACGGCDLGDPYLERHGAAVRPPLLPIVQGRSTAADGAGRRPDANEDDRGAAAESVAARPDAGEDGRAAAESVATRPDAGEAPQPPDATLPRVRLRFRYEKLGRAVHFSQLEAVSQVLRAIRHARLPVVFSEGHTPRPRVSFSPACPTGVESAAEYFEALCLAPASPAAWMAAVNRHLPEGLRVIEGSTVDGRASFSEQVAAMTYAVTVPGTGDAELRAAVAGFLAQPTRVVRVLRKGVPRDYDARAAVREITVGGDAVEVTLAFGGSGALKITEALAAILGPELAGRCKARKLAVSLGEGAPPPRVHPDAQPAGVLDLTRHGRAAAPAALVRAAPPGPGAPYVE